MKDDSEDKTVPATQAYRDAEGRPHLVEEQEEAARASEQAEQRRREVPPQPPILPPD